MFTGEVFSVLNTELLSMTTFYLKISLESRQTHGEKIHGCHKREQPVRKMSLR